MGRSVVHVAQSLFDFARVGIYIGFHGTDFADPLFGGLLAERRLGSIRLPMAHIHPPYDGLCPVNGIGVQFVQTKMPQCRGD
jgi:hypothetical protein